jgi:hypothetical protein
MMPPFPDKRKRGQIPGTVPPPGTVIFVMVPSLKQQDSWLLITFIEIRAGEP